MSVRWADDSRPPAVLEADSPAATVALVLILLALAVILGLTL